MPEKPRGLSDRRRWDREARRQLATAPVPKRREGGGRLLSRDGVIIVALALALGVGCIAWLRDQHARWRQILGLHACSGIELDGARAFALARARRIEVDDSGGTDSVTDRLADEAHHRAVEQCRSAMRRTP